MGLARYIPIMSHTSSAVTYTSVYTDFEPGRVFWGADKELSDGGPPRVIRTSTYFQLKNIHYPPVVSPTAESPGYVAESNPEEDPEEYEDDETEDGSVDYPMDEGDNGDDDDDDSSGYNADDEEEDEEEEHLAPVDFTVVIPTNELTSISLPPGAEVERLLAMPTPSPSPLTSLSPPSTGERLARCTAPTELPSPLLPPSLYPPPLVDRRDDIPESEQLPRKRLCLSTLGFRYEVGESSTRGRGVDYGFADTVEAEMRHRGIREVGYGIRDTWIDPTEAVPEMAPTTLEEVDTKVTELVELHEHDTQDLYALLKNVQDGRTRISQRVAMDSQRVDLLMEDRMTLQEIVWIVEEEAYAAREAWAHSIRDGSQISHGDNPRNVQTTRACFYADFMKCRPLNFKGNEGVVGLTRWIKKMESVFNINGCAIENQEVLKKKIMNKYYPQREVKKVEIELWNIKVKGNDVPTYTNRFQELTLICTKFVANENEKIDKYISGLPNSIYRNVKSSKPRTLDETIELTNDLMDQKLRTYAKRSDNKRKADDTSRSNHRHQQQPFKKQNVTKVYNMGTGERKPYEGSLPKCTKCQRHHNGSCTQKCHKCKKVGHFAHDYRSSGKANVSNAQRDNKETLKGNGCFECRASGHFKRDCPKLRNKNGGNRNAQGWVHAVRNAKKNGNAPMNLDSNVVTGTFLLNNRYASILFDTGADRNFISTAFSSLINIDPTPLGSSYDVELADGKIVEIDTIIRGCTLNFLNHPFNLYLMPMELGSFDVIIGMDWLRKYHAIIVCDEKLVHVPYGNETLIFHGNKNDNERESRLTISAKKGEDKPGGKQLKDVTIVRDFPKVFPEDLPGLPPARPVESQIDLIPGAAPVARAPYRLAPSEMKELSKQLH
nr:hypothetical protein [Tanacetum cinerariifolium]